MPLYKHRAYVKSLELSIWRTTRYSLVGKMSRGITVVTSLTLLLVAVHSLPWNLSNGDECDIFRPKVRESLDFDIKATPVSFTPNFDETMEFSNPSQVRFQLGQYLDCVSRSHKEHIFDKFLDLLQRMSPLDPDLLSPGPFTESKDHHLGERKQATDVSVPSQLNDVVFGLKEVRYDEHVTGKIIVNPDGLLRDMSNLSKVKSHKDEFYRGKKNTEEHERFEKLNSRQNLQNIGERNVDKDTNNKFGAGNFQIDDLRKFRADNLDGNYIDNEGYLNLKNMDFPKFIKRNFELEEMNKFDPKNFDREAIKKLGQKKFDTEENNKFGLNNFNNDEEINKFMPRVFDREEMIPFGPSHFDSGILPNEVAVERFNPTLSSSNILSYLVPASFERSHFPKFDLDDIPDQPINDVNINHLQDEKTQTILLRTIQSDEFH